MRILIADDNLVFQTVLQSMLTQWGHDVVTASNGEDALCLLQQDKGPKLAILDWLMPGLDGIEVCRRVRDSNHLSYTYILILTAKTASEDLLAAMEAGADDYVTKPFKSAELRARLNVGCRVVALQERLDFTQPLAYAPAFDASHEYSPVRPARNPRRSAASVTEIHRIPRGCS
jgi:two-component system, cell cycle response regulator